jgi:hypothetical protein
MYKFDNDNKEEEEAETSQTAMSSLNETSKDVLSIVVRMCGLLLLFAGLFLAVYTFGEVLNLYKDPTNIERMAKFIESGSNIDKSIAPIRDSILGEDGDEAGTLAISKDNKDGFRISYFIAWVVDLLLLLLLARIAIMAVKTGGELTLYDAQMNRFAKKIVKASRE